MSVTAQPELIRLPNGVRIALDPMPGLLTASVGVWIRVGARWEDASQNGIAHLFEHMAFKGANGRDAQQFAEAVESVGAIMNATTSYERTTYYARMLKEHAPFAFDLIADVILAPRWLAEDLEKEKGVVSQERGEALDQPDDRVFELHQAVLFAGQPLGRPVLGEEGVVAALDIAALEAFRDAHYAPERIVIGAAGGFDREALIERVAARFGALSKRAAIPAQAAAAQGGANIEKRRLEQTHLVLSWPAPAAGAPEGYAVRLLSEIYGGGMASRLFQDVRENRGLVYAVDSFVDAYEDVGRLGVYAGCASANAAIVAERAGAILVDLAEAGPTEGELRRAKAVVGAQMMMGAEAPSARAEARVSQIFLRDRLIPFEEIRAKVEAVTVEEVRALARQAVSSPGAAAAIGSAQGVKAAQAFAARFV
ncbi:MAG: pitrilysin family protein [Pseudomonadota bacterium]